jgi:phytoene dehydrogenase-like protein
MTAHYEYIVIGAGHNGLVCATLLARRGRKVVLLESAAQVGGMSITREFAPGFKVSACAHLINALPGDLVRDLNLESHGLKFAARAMSTTALNASGAPIVLSPSGVSGVEPKDAASLARFNTQMTRFSAIIGRVLGLVPFRVSLPSWRERLDALRLALKVRLLGRRNMREFLRIAGMNAYDLLDDTFDSKLLKGALALDATLGAEHAARSPGTVLTLLYRWAGLVRAGGISQPVGGMGAVTEAMASAARAAGVEIRTSARVKRIVVESDRASGVLLESGESIVAEAVISSADPKTTFLKLLGAEFLDTDFVRRIDHFRSRGVVAKLHLALDAVPAFKGVDAVGLKGRLLVAPSLDYLELAFNPSKYGEIPENPVLEITVPTANDPSLAPAGMHVLSINVMFVPYEVRVDAAGARDKLLANVMATLERHAPGISGHIKASELLTPADIEREFGVGGGHWHHGALAFDQFFFTRPVPGATQYSTPMAGLFLCGAGSHPGGGVMGIAGGNAARRILEGAN